MGVVPGGGSARGRQGVMSVPVGKRRWPGGRAENSLGETQAGEKPPGDSEGHLEDRHAALRPGCDWSYSDLPQPRDLLSGDSEGSAGSEERWEAPGPAGALNTGASPFVVRNWGSFVWGRKGGRAQTIREIFNLVLQNGRFVADRGF